jgi:hypothetical protein
MRSLKVGDRVQYWYRMGRVGTIIGIRRAQRETHMVGGSAQQAVNIIVRFDDGAEELYPVSELRLVE